MGGRLQLYGFGLVERDTPCFTTTNRHLFTPGVWLTRAPASGAFDYDLEATYRTGQARRTSAVTDRTDLDVSACYLHLGLGYRFAGGWQPRVVHQ